MTHPARSPVPYHVAVRAKPRGIAGKIGRFPSPGSKAAETRLEPISEMAQQNAGAAEQNEAEEVDFVSLPAIRQPAVAK